MKPSVIPVHPDTYNKIAIMMGRRSGKSLIMKAQIKQAKLERENEALHKTAAFLADEARRTEKAMERGRYRR